MRISRLLLAAALTAVPCLLGVARANEFCGSCRTSYVVVPYPNVLPGHCCILTEGGGLDFYDAYPGLPGMDATKHWCVCMDAEGHTGPNDPPEVRSCGYFSDEISGTVDEDYVESPYCEWKTGHPGETDCGNTLNHCPRL